MFKKTIVRFDSRLTAAITRWPKWLQAPMLVVTFIGQPVCLIIMATVVAAVNQNNLSIVLALAAALGAMLINTTIKHFVHRTRPDTLYVSNMYFKTASFPSGHAFGGVVVMGLLAYLTGIYVSQALAALMVALIASIGISRVYLGAHYPTDILAGWLLGSVFLSIIIGMFHP